MLLKNWANSLARRAPSSSEVNDEGLATSCSLNSCFIIFQGMQIVVYFHFRLWLSSRLRRLRDWSGDGSRRRGGLGKHAKFNHLGSHLFQTLVQVSVVDAKLLGS